MMAEFRTSVDIPAPPAQVWAVLADVARWPEWTPTVTRVEALDGPLAPGARFRLAQPTLDPAVWTVATVEPERAFAWVARQPGVVSTADHTLTPTPEGTRVELAVRMEGPFGWLGGLLFGRLTREYLAQEASSLRARVLAGGPAHPPG